MQDRHTLVQQPSSRRLARSLVVLTVLLGGLGTIGYFWQAARAKQIARRWWEGGALLGTVPGSVEGWVYKDPRREYLPQQWIGEWQTEPFYGYWVEESVGGKVGTVWVPRRTSLEFLKLMTGQDLGEDPGAWHAWFQAHPNLVWDDKQKRLAERSVP